MKLIIQTKIAEIDNYKQLDDEFNSLILLFFEKYFLNPYQTVDSLFGSYPSDFDQKLKGYFYRVSKPDQQDDVFNALTPIFNSYVSSGLLDEAQNLWERLLKTTHDWEKESKRRVHKGSLFYFWAQPAIVKGDIDTGFFLIHQAIEEDKKTSGENYIQSPAYKTATLNFLDEGQFLYNFVIKWRDFLSKNIDIYNYSYGKNLSLEDFNKTFLSFKPINETIYSFSHILAKFCKLSDTPQEIIKNSYASIFEINLLFNLILIIDAVLYYKNSANWRFKTLSNNLLCASGLNRNNKNNGQYLSELLGLFEDNPDQTINNLLNREISLSDGYIPNGLECDIYLAYLLRNHSAHNLSSISSIWEKFGDIQQKIINVLFLSIEVFY